VRSVPAGRYEVGGWRHTLEPRATPNPGVWMPLPCGPQMPSYLGHKSIIEPIRGNKCQATIQSLRDILSFAVAMERLAQSITSHRSLPARRRFLTGPNKLGTCRIETRKFPDRRF